MNDDVGTLIEPAPVTFTWGSPGWYVLGVIILLVIVIVLLIVNHHYQKNKYRKAALSFLKKKEGLLATQPVQAVYDTAMLMKRVAITRYGRTKVASLRDKEWISFLNRSCRSSMFTESDGVWLGRVLYIPGEPVQEKDASGFIVKAKKWIKDHRYAL